MLDSVISMLGGKSALKSLAGKITVTLEEMKLENENIPDSCESVYINIFKINEKIRINFAYVDVQTNEMVVFENHSVESLTVKNPMLGLMAKPVKKMLENFQKDVEGVLILSILNVNDKDKEGKDALKTIIRFTDTAKNKIVNEFDFFEILEQI